MIAPTPQQHAALYKATGATSALLELRERFQQAGLAPEYLEVLDAFRDEKAQEQELASVPFWAYAQRAIADVLPPVTDEPVAPYSVAYVAGAAA